MEKVAIITFTDSKVLPVEVKFPTNTSHYATIEKALADCKLLGCKPLFHVEPKN